ncbi:glutathione-dependent disulfide-bond oxidoreductase [Shewanella youngdeokensis]|uniref:Glutathione-dependent disulfide-bond oxidoreductase n=1 Tax=Shewanella youngdeokensis TaxID=2999068 RepID=A0ABZ0JVY8_9GAMM|nr:glutathione-dependent disulfide-bond oxidoreductase [Shewanella sp. DAU334]
MSNDYTPAKVWTMDNDNGGKFANINRPDSGARYQQALSVGEHSLQLHSLATPNGQKVTILLEELLKKGVTEAEYDAFSVSIMEGEQFSSGFVAINPNSKIPALVDNSGDTPIRIFESGSILVYLAEKFGHFIPSDIAKRTETMNWLFWLQGAAPYLGGGFGHFYAYAPEKFEYPINRFTMETKRQLDVLDKQLANNEYISGDEYTIADMAIWPWYGNLMLGNLYDAAEFLDVCSYTHLQRWAKQIAARSAVKRGEIVNRTWGEEWQQLAERHSAADIDAVLNKQP